MWIQTRLINKRPNLQPASDSARGKEFKVNTHHLFIDFKQAYDRTKLSELYVAMKEHDFETKLIRLVKVTLDGT